jgi:hypothetical protein
MEIIHNYDWELIKRDYIVNDIPLQELSHKYDISTIKLFEHLQEWTIVRIFWRIKNKEASISEVKQLMLEVSSLETSNIKGLQMASKIALDMLRNFSGNDDELLDSVKALNLIVKTLTEIHKTIQSITIDSNTESQRLLEEVDDLGVEKDDDLIDLEIDYKKSMVKKYKSPRDLQIIKDYEEYLEMINYNKKEVS